MANTPMLSAPPLPSGPHFGTQYKGIPGVIVCLGGTDGCSVNAAGNLVGDWYFLAGFDDEELFVEGTGGAYDGGDHVCPLRLLAHRTMRPPTNVATRFDSLHGIADAVNRATYWSTANTTGLNLATEAGSIRLVG